MTTSRLSEPARRLQRLLLRQAEPSRMLMTELPEQMGFPIIDDCVELLAALRSCKQELEGTIDRYTSVGITSLRHALRLWPDGSQESARALAGQWASCFRQIPMNGLTDEIARGMVARLQMPYDSDSDLIESLSSLLVGKSVRRWDDTSAAAFDRQIQNAVRRVEEYALSVASERVGGSEALADLVCRRMGEMMVRLVGLAGKEAAQSRVRELLAKHQGGSRGDDPGSPDRSV